MTSATHAAKQAGTLVGYGMLSARDRVSGEALSSVLMARLRMRRGSSNGTGSGADADDADERDGEVEVGEGEEEEEAAVAAALAAVALPAAGIAEYVEVHMEQVCTAVCTAGVEVHMEVCTAVCTAGVEVHMEQVCTAVLCHRCIADVLPMYFYKLHALGIDRP